ncbi:ABC transporter ATP-binding protein [Lentibacillus saliphilus]|uniref:ABC transporter ATP-binding protein n=1 Tax=Lentibacillus saliphilus TaxID=2737028 RepID=UPI001C3071A5|nr:ABC transporter ATP-binding protein [Lentibacillus saliphilus]
MKILEVINVNKYIKDARLIHNVSFSLEAGKVLGLVGHNGAGKSTLIKTIMGVFEKTAGEIRISGYDQDDNLLSYKQCLSYIPEEPLLVTELTVMQHFQLYGMSYGLSKQELDERVERYVAGFELGDKLNDYPDALSKGMRQKVQTICALLPNTPLLIIDEPFMGLDIYAMDYLVTLIKEKVAGGTAVILSTHQLERVKDIADYYLMLQEGEVQEEGSIADFEVIQRRTNV